MGGTYSIVVVVAACVCAYVRAYVRAYVCACVRLCVCACVRVSILLFRKYFFLFHNIFLKSIF